MLVRLRPPTPPVTSIGTDLLGGRIVTVLRLRLLVPMLEVWDLGLSGYGNNSKTPGDILA